LFSFRCHTLVACCPGTDHENDGVLSVMMVVLAGNAASGADTI
jgi:hypothetical protein